MANRVGSREVSSPETEYRRGVMAAAEEFRRKTASLGAAPLTMREYILACALRDIAAGKILARETVVYAADAFERWEVYLPEGVR
jgi:hypothetical protein